MDKTLVSVEVLNISQDNELVLFLHGDVETFEQDDGKILRFRIVDENSKDHFQIIFTK